MGWLKATNLTTTHPTSKLLPKWYGPFDITDVISNVVYKLKLPPQWKIHNVFHASLLSPYHETTTHGPNYHEPPPDVIDGEKEWEVEEIMGSRRYRHWKKLQYLIRWEGYSTAHDSWEPAEGIHAPNLVRNFERQQKDKRDTMSSESLPSSLTLIAINSIMVSRSSSTNDLGTALVEEAALNIMQAAQGGDDEGDHISVLSGSLAHSSYSIDVGVKAEDTRRRPSTPYMPRTPTPDSPSPTESSGSEPPLYVPPPLVNDSEHPGYPWYSARHINGEVQARMTFERQTPARYLRTGVS